VLFTARSVPYLALPYEYVMVRKARIVWYLALPYEYVMVRTARGTVSVVAF
jgi:hypothetical protein